MGSKNGQSLCRTLDGFNRKYAKMVYKDRNIVGVSVLLFHTLKKFPTAKLPSGK